MKRKASQIIGTYDDKEPSLKTAEQAKKMKKKLNRDLSFEHEMLATTNLNDKQSDSYLGNSDSDSDPEFNPCVEKEGMVTKTKKKEEKRSLGESAVDGRSNRASEESGSEHDKDSGKEEDSNVDREYTALKEELSSLSFEELLKVKEKIGLKVFNQLMYGSKMKSAVTETSKPNKKFKRENKNRPMEMSSKSNVPRVRQIMPVKKKIARDPRFDDLSGQYNETFFKEAYSFLDDVKAKEKEKVKALLKKEKDEEKKKNMQALVNRMNQQEQSMLQKKKQTGLLNEWKKKEEERIKEGKNPYFLKKSDKKTLILAEKYKELKKSGKVEKYLNKKRKKNAQKERKKLPGRFDH
ncbi:hypothetical protein CHS0354_042702 [Potamilus streckersoni]|uniref:rRNA biogenesis protein RRP36 n=1 Tax=Potamilus streckersoni TaxID=2493646 RepID=A0AAE0VSP7_9BIVA|nr:hypothetical protein CHS0354_042702 [Potamilus streckersoni]